MTTTPPLPNGFGARLKARREALGWTKARLHRESGVGRGTITYIENGTHTNSLANTVLALEQALGVKLRDEADYLPPPAPADNPQEQFLTTAIVAAAQLWHLEPHDQVKIDLLHAVVTYYNNQATP